LAACGADYGFEYSDEEPEEEDVDIENQYYNSKGTNYNLRLTEVCPAAAAARAKGPRGTT
jgi:hypothetical protein